MFETLTQEHQFAIMTGHDLLLVNYREILRTLFIFGNKKNEETF